MAYIPRTRRKEPHPHQHILSFWKWLAEGGENASWSDTDLVDELRADTSAMSPEDVEKAKKLAREGAEQVKAARVKGHNGRSREIAVNTAQEMAALIGDRLIAPAARTLPDDPRALADMIRRKGV